MIFLTRTPVADPVINLLFAELPKTPNLMGGHVPAVDPLVDRIPLDPDVDRDFIDGEPAVVHTEPSLGWRHIPAELISVHEVLPKAD